MRDDQIMNIIKKECAYIDNISLLRNQQSRIRIDSIISAMCEPFCLIKALFNPKYLYKKIDEIYQIKVRDFNNSIKEIADKRGLKI